MVTELKVRGRVDLGGQSRGEEIRTTAQGNLLYAPLISESTSAFPLPSLQLLEGALITLALLLKPKYIRTNLKGPN